MKYLSGLMAIWLTSSCAVQATSRLTLPLSEAHSFLIAQDMVRILRQDWPRALTSFFVENASHPSLEVALRLAGFAVDVKREADSLPAELKLFSLPDAYHQAVLTVNQVWRLSRLYRVVRTNLEPQSAFSLTGHRGPEPLLVDRTWNFSETEVLEKNEPTEAWYVDVLTTPDTAALDRAQAHLRDLGYGVALVPILHAKAKTLRLGPVVQPLAARNLLGAVRQKGFDAAKLVAVRATVVLSADTSIPGVPPAPAPCTLMKIERGSLQSNIRRLISECGYRMGTWQFGTADTTKDWIVSKSFEITSATGVFGLLDFLLGAYGIEAVPHSATGVIDFKGL